VSIQLRSYKPEDFETLWALDQVCYDDEVAYSKRELMAYLKYPGADCVVAEFSGEIAGFCISAHEDDRGYIVTIDVLEKFRREKIGSALIDEIEKRLIGFGVKLVSLETATDTPASVAFWKKHGYIERGIRKNYYPKGRDAYAMTKTLSPDFRARHKTPKTR
jgi:[ribosomal protein S18]-alanine N-acetyltransferase